MHIHVHVHMSIVIARAIGTVDTNTYVVQYTCPMQHGIQHTHILEGSWVVSTN